MASFFDSTLSAGQAIWRRICEAVLAQIQVELAALKELNRLLDQWVGLLLQPAKFKLRHKIQFQFRTFHCPVSTIFNFRHFFSTKPRGGEGRGGPDWGTANLR